jgi:hypothetical protein
MLTETVYADYKDFGGVQFPTKIIQKQGGFPTLDLTISKATANAPATIQPPYNVRQASIKVQADKVADGVWYVTGGTAIVAPAERVLQRRRSGPQGRLRSLTRRFRGTAWPPSGGVETSRPLLPRWDRAGLQRSGDLD